MTDRKMERAKSENIPNGNILKEHEVITPREASSKDLLFPLLRARDAHVMDFWKFVGSQSLGGSLFASQTWLRDIQSLMPCLHLAGMGWELSHTVRWLIFLEPVKCRSVIRSHVVFLE